MTNQWLQRVTERHGFQMVSDHTANVAVWERNGLRLRTTIRRKGTGQREIGCELVAPNHKELLPFVFNDAEESCQVRFFDEQLFKRQVFHTEQAYEQFVSRISNLATLFNQDLKNQAEWLWTVPLEQVTAVTEDAPSLRTFQEGLRVFRALQVSARHGSLLAHLKALALGQVIEIHPSLCLSHADGKRLLDLLGDLSQLNDSVVLLNAGLLDTDERLRAGVGVFLERLNLQPTLGGARFLLHQTKDSRGEGHLPRLHLPDITGEATRPLLEQATLAVTPEHLAVLEGFQAHGEPPDAGITWLRETERWASGVKSFGANRLRFVESSSPSSGAGQLVEWVERTRAQLAARVVGHEDIISQLSIRLPLWFLLERDKPLVLALVGPSGCGKNHVLEVVASILQDYFQLPSPHLVIYNCGQAWDEKRWELTGVGCGHVGSDRPGLIESLGAGSVFLADEVDKRLSQPGDFQSFLIQWLDDGFIRNGHGDLVRTPRCVIGLAMNAGASANADRWRTIGFGNRETPVEAVRAHYREHLEKQLLPALQGRLDVRLFFSQLTPENLEILALRELERAQREFEALGLAPWTSDLRSLAQQMARQANPDLGARAILHAVRDYKTQLIESLCQSPHPSSPTKTAGLTVKPSAGAAS